MQSEAVNQERTDTTIAKIQKSKEGFEDTKGVIRICISKNRQHNGQKKKYKRPNSDLQNT